MSVVDRQIPSHGSSVGLGACFSSLALSEHHSLTRPSRNQMDPRERVMRKRQDLAIIAMAQIILFLFLILKMSHGIILNSPL